MEQEKSDLDSSADRIDPLVFHLNQIKTSNKA